MKRIFIAGFMLWFSFPSLAGTASFFPITAETPKFYFGVGLGKMFYNLSEDNRIGTGSGWPDDYYGTHSISNELYGFLAAGYEWERQETWFPNYSLGLRYMYASSALISGYIEQYSLPEFQNYRFSYNVQILNLLGVFKVDLYRFHNFMPYILLGAGVASYYASDYKEYALSTVTPRVSPGFGSHSGNNFAYELGVGIDYALRENLTMNIEYDYMNNGTVKTGNGADYSTLTGTNYDNESLENKITASTLFVGLTYYMQ